MIGTSRGEYIFIRMSIFALRAIAPLSVLYCLYLILFCGLQSLSCRRLPIPVEVYLIAEALFYALVLVRLEWLQVEAVHPAPLPRAERRRLFDLCMLHTPCPDEFLRKWFLGAPLGEIKKENMKEWLLWAFFNKGGPPGEENAELEEYVTATEEVIGRKFQDGRGKAKCLRLTLDRFDCQHHCLLWYLIVSLVDCYTHANLSRHGFKYYRTSLKRFFTHFPLRPITVFGKHCSPTKHLTYWYHPSTSPNKLPIVFLHGIGIGLYPYVNFLADLSFPVTPGEQPGVLAVELLPISFRLTADSSLRWSQLFTELRTILAHHKITRFILVSHSYGTALSTRLLHDPILSSQIDSLVLIDPICFLLHLPDVAYNFTRRKPQRANEWQLYYFASMDVGVAHSLGRNFFWSKCVLWREGLEGKRCTVSLSGRDLIVDTAAVRRYLTDGSGRKGRDRAADGIEASGRTNEQQHVTSSSLANGNSESERPVTYRDNPDSCISSTWISRSHRRTGLDVLWHPDLDHAQVFDHVQTRRPLVEAVLSYSCKEHDDQE